MICNQSILFAAILGLGVFGTAATEAVEIRERDGWDLVWADEFNTPGQPDPEEWTYDRGLRRNQESQFYTDKPENCRIEDGKLILEARRERVKNPNFVPGSSNWKEAEFAEYTSACVVAKRDFLYGRLEIRAKIPAGKGTWPAFWLLGKSGYAGKWWPECCEIDILEYLGKDPSNIINDVHYKGSDGKHKHAARRISAGAPSEDFHIYALEWDETELRFYYDDRMTSKFTIAEADSGDENPFRHPFELRLNFALGGWGGTVDPQILPLRYEIDYVRHYQKKNQAAE